MEIQFNQNLLFNQLHRASDTKIVNHLVKKVYFDENNKKEVYDYQKPKDRIEVLNKNNLK